MALYLMGIMTVVFLLSTFIVVFLLNYKDGKFVEKTSHFIIISSIIILGLFINYSALPSNFIKERILTIALLLVGIVNMFLYKKNNFISRVVLSFLAFMSLLMYL